MLFMITYKRGKNISAAGVFFFQVYKDQIVIKRIMICMEIHKDATQSPPQAPFFFKGTRNHVFYETS